MKTRSILLNTAASFCIAATLLGTAHAGQLKVGAARVDISAHAYEDGQPPADRTYAHEWLYVRAIVLDNGETRAALIGADMSGIRPDEVYRDTVAEIVRELGIPAEHVLMSGTHTHSGVRELRDAARTQAAILEAVRKASANLQSATVGFGEGAVYLNTNRDTIDAETGRWTQAANPDFPSDKTLAVLAFYGENGLPIAGYMNYAMHPVSGYLAGFRSGDFAGAGSRHVEQAFRDNMVMIFSQGASGDQNPLHLRAGTNVMAAVSGTEVTGFELTREAVEGPLRSGEVERLPNDPDVDEVLKRWMDAQGQVLGEEAIRVMSRIGRKVSDARIGGTLSTITCPGRVRVDSGGREGYPGTYEDGPDATHRIGILGINEIILASINAEVYNLIGQQVKAASPLSKTVFVTVANGRAGFGYIPTDDAYGRQTFQVLGARQKQGCAEQKIVAGIADMIYDYIL